MRPDPTFEINTDPGSVQSLRPLSKNEKFEGVGFSSSGNVIGLATSDTNAVVLFRRKADGHFEDTPYQTIGGSNAGLDYPHDVSFSKHGDSELLAVAQRAGAIAIYEKSRADDTYGSKPVFEIRGPEARLAFSDGAAFVPPNNEYLAACNYELGTISFFRRVSPSSNAFETTPDFELKHPGIYRPDGLAFSRCGKWLAVANHGKQTVCIFQRRNRILSGGKLRYGPEPVTIIEDPQLRYPHSVAFSPQTNHLVVTNAGANYFCVYQPKRRTFKMRWSQSPKVRVTVGTDEAFSEVNMANKMEGGPKGVAIDKDSLAICSPQIGVKIYTFREKR